MCTLSSCNFSNNPSPSTLDFLEQLIIEKSSSFEEVSIGHANHYMNDDRSQNGTSLALYISIYVPLHIFLYINLFISLFPYPSKGQIVVPVTFRPPALISVSAFSFIVFLVSILTVLPHTIFPINFSHSHHFSECNGIVRKVVALVSIHTQLSFWL